MATEQVPHPIVVRGTEILSNDDRQRYREKIARITLDSMVQFVGLLDAQGTVLEINKVALDAVGSKLSDVEGQAFWTTFWWQVSEEVNLTLRQAIKLASEGEFVRWDAEIYGRAGGKETIIIDASLMPVRDDDGRVVFICAEGRDITEKKAHEREIARQREELAQLDKLKTQFFANISHEFRTPLTLMLGPLEDALDECDGLSKTNRDRLELTRRNSLRLLKLVNTLLDFSRIEAGRIQATFERIDLSAFTTELASTFRSAIERAGMRLVVDCPPLPEQVYVDREMWEKIVLNLLSNAFKFTFAGEIEVSLRVIGRAIRLAVCDSGTGIPAEEIPRLFERFHRVKGARGRSYEGSGIGLALVQELIKLHGGTVEVQSQEGQGSAFSVTIPLGNAHLAAERVEAPRLLDSTGTRSEAYIEEASRWQCNELPATGTKHVEASLPATDTIQHIGQLRGSTTGQRILIAEDNADMREYVRRLLHGYDIQEVANGAAALRAIQDRPPELVLSDVMMPELDGFGLLRELRSDPRTRAVPVILLSARAGEEARIEGMEAGADDYIAKPFSGRELLARVQAHLQLAALREESQAALRESEALHRVLSQLAAATQPLTEPVEIMAAAARILADHLAVDRCAYADVEGETVYVISGDHSVGVPSIIGRWNVAAFGAEHHRAMRAAEPYVVDDTEADPRISQDDLAAYRATDIRAVICVPLHKDGRFSSAMAVHQKTPRSWTAKEVRLVTEFVGRCWEALERARVTSELRDIRSRMETALKAAAIGTWAWDMQGDRFYGDMSLARIFGVPAEAVSDGPLAGLMNAIHPDDRERVGKLVAQAIESGGQYEADYRVAGRGTWRWVTARGQVELDDEGKAVKFPGVVIDITERKLAQEELGRVTQESERRKRLYETILSATPDFVYVFSLDHRVLYANDSLVSMWGVSDPIGKTFLEIGYEPWHAEMHCREIDTVRTTMRPIRGEVPFSGTTGRKIYDYIFVPVFGPDGQVEAVAGTTRDVTERKSMEEELRDTDRRKDDFIALLAHELRNPLAPIRNGLQVLRLAEGDPGARAEARQMMDRQLSHMVRLIDDLLDVSRINRNKMELIRARVSLSEVIASAVETARPAIDEAGHELSITLPAAPIYFHADLTRLAQVFSNLLTNSAKYTPNGGRIWLTAEREGEQAAVSVRDTGIGIPSTSLVDIFDMFGQVDRSIERSTGGLGIGLALVKGLVEMHGGSVSAASDGEGRGSTFTVTLPVLAERTVLQGAAPHIAKATTRPSRRILVVDDNRDGANSLAMMLKLMSNQVETANDGIEALEAAERFRPDIILMDVGMPRLNGLDATRKIREQAWGKSITIFALTGWGQQGDLERSREAGCDGHLVKPVSMHHLEQMLANASLD